MKEKIFMYFSFIKDYIISFHEHIFFFIIIIWEVFKHLSSSLVLCTHL